MDHYCSQVLRHIRFTFLQCQTSLCAFHTALHQAAIIADCDLLQLSHADMSLAILSRGKYADVPYVSDSVYMQVEASE